MDRQYLKMAAVVLVSLIAIIFFLRSCDGDREYNILKGRFSAFKETVSKEKEKTEKAVSEQLKKINSLEQKNQDLSIENVSIKARGRERDADLKRLESELSSIPVDDKSAVIVNLKSQIVAWRDKFSLAQQEIANKDKIIFNLKEKYNSQVVITKQWESRYQSENRLRLLAEELMKVCDKRLARKSFESRIERVVILALGGYVAYKLIKEI